jgi:hypothetical protein
MLDFFVAFALGWVAHWALVKWGPIRG